MSTFSRDGDARIVVASCAVWFICPMQSCPRVTFLGPNPTRPGKTLTRPDPTRDCRQKVWPDPRSDPSSICAFFNWIIINLFIFYYYILNIVENQSIRMIEDSYRFRYQEIFSKKLNTPKCWPDPTRPAKIRQNRGPTRPDPTRPDPTRPEPDPTRPASPSDPWTTLVPWHLSHESEWLKKHFVHVNW